MFRGKGFQWWGNYVQGAFSAPFADLDLMIALGGVGRCAGDCSDAGGGP